MECCCCYDADQPFAVVCVCCIDANPPFVFCMCTCISTVVEYFLSRKGIILSAIDRWGSTPMDDAIESKHEGTITAMKQALAESGARAQRSVDKKIVNGWLNAVKNREIACAMRTWKMFVKRPTVQYSKQ